MSDNIMYFGEPLALTLCALFNCICALALWIFGTFGGPAGVLTLLSAFYVVTRVFVVFSMLSRWKNDALTDEERQRRREWQVKARPDLPRPLAKFMLESGGGSMTPPPLAVEASIVSVGSR